MHFALEYAEPGKGITTILKLIFKQDEDWGLKLDPGLLLYPKIQLELRIWVGIWHSDTFQDKEEEHNMTFDWSNLHHNGIISKWNMHQHLVANQTIAWKFVLLK